MTRKAWRILVTGVGSIGGINFVRSLRFAVPDEIFIIGTDHDERYAILSDADKVYLSPPFQDETFIQTLLDLVRKYDLNFVHPHPSVEARLVAKSHSSFEKSGAKTFLPRCEDIIPDKSYIYERLKKSNVSLPRTFQITAYEDVELAFKEADGPFWIRARKGAGGKLGIKVNSEKEALSWIKFNISQGRAKGIEDFLIHEYLSGRDLAFDSLWYEGNLVTSYARERIEYVLKNVSLSGITGTPSIARTVHEKAINDLGKLAIRGLNPKPHGFYSVDIKEDSEGVPKVTEVDGKWHTTAPLWGHAFAKAFSKNSFNLAYLYIKLGFGENIDFDLPNVNLFPENYYLIRQLDAGAILKHENQVWKII